MEYCARDDFFIELPQIFNAATAARDHDEIDRRKYLVRRGELANGHCNFLRRAGPLHAHRVDQNLQPRRATTGHVQNVADSWAAWGSDIPDPMREFGQGPFRLRSNNPFCLKFAL